MKKNIYFISIVVISLVLLSCKSSKEASDGLEVEGVDNVVSMEIQDDNEKLSEKEAEKKAKKEKKAAEKKAKEDAKKAENAEELDERGLFGWIDPAAKNPSIEDGIVHIKTDGKLGTFCIYAVDAKGRKFPVLSTLNEFSSTNFFLKAGKKKYKLIADKKIRADVKGLDNGISLLYNIKDVAEVYVKMEVFPSVVNKPSDTVKVSINVKNMGNSTDTFAVKTILDTILGERGSAHFYTYEDIPIRSEFYSRSMKDQGWFTSKNERASMQILLDGGDVTPPEFVALASYSTLEKGDWEPDMHTLGAFDTVLSYNNSAVGIIWPEVRLTQGESSKITFYISLALDGLKPNGYRYVYGLPVVEEEKPVDDVFVFPVTEKKEKEEKPTVAPVEEIVVQPNIIEGSSNKSVEFNVDNIAKEHLTQEYVQSLIDRITELEQAGAQVNRAELLQLNAELDAILSILKK